ncbi:Gfo/Idh/MocA family protein [Sulfurimonas sp.]|uniref:Gfo/Idh/MocA family protein n=1 Tax=Sulfurimonas sp. TaxID=2022749 RepID=UPI003566DB40
MKVAQLGYGYWGTNIAKALFNTKDIEVHSIFDLDKKRLKEAQKLHEFTAYQTVDELLKSDIEAVFISTPLATHYPLIKQSLLAGKHIFVEKPFAQNIEQTKELIDLAKEKNKIIFSDHIFLYSNAVQYIKEHIHTIGKVIHISSKRQNLGLFRDYDGAIDDLAVHDLYILEYLLDGISIDNLYVNTTKYKNFSNDNEAMATILFTCGETTINIDVSWFHPKKIREITIIGEDKTIIYNDLAKDQIEVISSGKFVQEKDTDDALYNQNISCPEIYIERPEITSSMSLNNAIEHFVMSVKENKEPLSGKESILKLAYNLQIIKKAIND